MRLFNLIFRSLTVLLVLGTSEASISAEFYGRVVRVHSGDRLDILQQGRAYHTRLYGIFCPRGVLAQEATHFTRQMASARGVHVITEGGHDLHGSVYVRVHFLGGKDLSQELVRAGLARWNRKQAPAEATLARLETEARRARRGLWASTDPSHG